MVWMQAQHSLARASACTRLHGTLPTPARCKRVEFYVCRCKYAWKGRGGGRMAHLPRLPVVRLGASVSSQEGERVKERFDELF